MVSREKLGILRLAEFILSVSEGPAQDDRLARRRGVVARGRGFEDLTKARFRRELESTTVAADRRDAVAGVCGVGIGIGFGIGIESHDALSN